MVLLTLCFALTGSVGKLYGFFADASAPTAVLGTNPFAGERFYVDPDSQAKRQADEWRSSRPEDAAQMDKIAQQPGTYYFGEWTEDTPEGTEGQIDYRVSEIEEAGALPVIGMFAIPNRDCGHYSGGGLGSPDAYKRWVDGVAAGIGARKAVVVLEPDAVAALDCLSEADERDRYDLLSYAVAKLKSNPRTYVYVDAGNPRWHPTEVMADRLLKANIAAADGFTLNVSNFVHASENIAYGKDLSSRISGKHFVIDTSRNGLGPWDDNDGDPEPWCNPPGRALGPEPTAATGEPLADAYFWMKWPGESDGECRGYGPAGTWEPEYALDLAQRAAW